MFNDFKAVELAAQKKELAVQSAKEHENTLIKYETDKKKELNGQSEHCRAALQIANEFVRSGQTDRKSTRLNSSHVD